MPPFLRVAVCKLRTNQLDDTQGVSPAPQAAPVPIRPNAKEMALGSTMNPAPTWANMATPKSDKVPEKSALQASKAQPVTETPVKEGETSPPDSQIAHYKKATAALLEGGTLRDNLKAKMLALKVTLPPETRPGVRVDQATATGAPAATVPI